MIKVEKNFEDIPKILTNKIREEAFYQNIKVGAFEHGKNLYKPNSVKKRLKEDIYHNKCAYCEKDISDEPQSIEHYRPKDSYYWLAYSWDNLLLCCTRCNSKKREQFKTLSKKVTYKNEKFEEIHHLGTKYDRLEQPMIINPEKDDVIKDIKFKKDGTIYSENKRVEHTIEIACNLNRDELVQHRVAIINDFKNLVQDYFEIFLMTKDITIFKPIIDNFLLKAKKESEYFAFREFVLNNIDLFFENKYAKIIRKFLELKCKERGKK